MDINCRQSQIYVRSLYACVLFRVKEKKHSTISHQCNKATTHIAQAIRVIEPYTGVCLLIAVYKSTAKIHKHIVCMLLQHSSFFQLFVMAFVTRFAYVQKSHLDCGIQSKRRIHTHETHSAILQTAISVRLRLASNDIWLNIIPFTYIFRMFFTDSQTCAFSISQHVQLGKKRISAFERITYINDPNTDIEPRILHEYGHIDSSGNMSSISYG